MYPGEGKITEILLAEFDITSGKAHFTDPCYSADTWCANFNMKTKCGKWLARGYVGSTGSFFGDRVVMLELMHRDHMTPELEDLPGDDDWDWDVQACGVDSGIMGMFDAEIYGGGEYDEPGTFYHACCHRGKDTKDINKAVASTPIAPIFGKGVISSSGYGDGMYPLGIRRNENGEVTNAVVVFVDIWTDEDDEAELN